MRDDTLNNALRIVSLKIYLLKPRGLSKHFDQFRHGLSRRVMTLSTMFTHRFIEYLFTKASWSIKTF